MKGLMATMFGFYCDVVLGKYLKDFLLESDIIESVA